MSQIPFRTRTLEWLRQISRIGENPQTRLIALAIAVGIAGGVGAILLRFAIQAVQYVFLGSGTESLSSHAESLSWWQLILAPTAGGLLVGYLVHKFLPQGRPASVAQAMEASALQGGRMSLWVGVKGAMVNALSIGSGASVGREGPAVHLGASLGSFIADRLELSRAQTRTLLGCGVASAVAASFNAPLAGTLFALEVVVGNYALTAFAPIVLAAVTGTIISRLQYGDYPAFLLPSHTIASFWEVPAFILLGVCCSVVAIALMRGISFVNQTIRPRLPGPAWASPAFAGLAVGVIALFFPQVLGVGYEATDKALTGYYEFWYVPAILVAKLVATALCIGLGFGGGLFSPALFLGAMTGLVFGGVATLIFPALSSGASAYALVGMGATAGAVLGAPISTIMMIFELHGEFKTAVVVMISTVIANLITAQIYGPSFFHQQIKAQGKDLREGREARIMRRRTVKEVMRRDAEVVTPDMHPQEILDHLENAPNGIVYMVDGDGILLGAISLPDLHDALHDRGMEDLLTALDVAHREDVVVAQEMSLQNALRRMRQHNLSQLPVVDDERRRGFLGFVRELDVLRAYNVALVEARREERGEE